MKMLSPGGMANPFDDGGETVCVIGVTGGFGSATIPFAALAGSLPKVTCGWSAGTMSVIPFVRFVAASTVAPELVTETEVSAPFAAHCAVVNPLYVRVGPKIEG